MTDYNVFLLLLFVRTIIFFTLHVLKLFYHVTKELLFTENRIQ